MDSTADDRLEDALTQHDPVESLAQTLQLPLRRALEALPPAVVSALHGEPFGHPLHPLLVHLPLGGWLIAGVLDVLPLPDTDAAADLALLLGTVGASGTIATGWTDWANTEGAARRTGLVHGLLNEVAFLMQAASVLSRRRGDRATGRLLSGGALALAVAGGFLGGQLVYRHGLGVEATLATPQG
ncbi:DUF2231 domain-containing protein [Deinococcus sp.]|uniref:DUF2231 domain-containing protein n=1 Tax=Deinococcus sp. TaxID=47478 RepID=UPI003C7CF754